MSNGLSVNMNNPQIGVKKPVFGSNPLNLPSKPGMPAALPDEFVKTTVATEPQIPENAQISAHITSHEQQTEQPETAQTPAQPAQGDVSLTGKEPKKKKSVKGLLYSAGGAILLAGGYLLLTSASKSGTSFKKFFNKIGDWMEKSELFDMQKIRANLKNPDTTLGKVAQKSKEGIDIFSAVTGNFNVWKDKIAEKVLTLGDNKFGRAFIDGCRNIYRDISILTIDTAYSLGRHKIENFYVPLKRLGAKGEAASKHIDEAMKIFGENFSKKARATRYDEVEKFSAKFSEGLNSKMGLDFLTSKENLSEYVVNRETKALIQSTDKALEKARTQIMEKIDAAIAALKSSGATDKEIKSFEKQRAAVLKTLTKANSYEGSPFIVKMAELATGSATTDVINAFGISSVILGANILGEKDHDKRISKTLTLGIPVLGGIGMSIVGSSLMWSAPLAIALGLGSAKIFSIGGNMLNNMRKDYAERQSLIKAAMDAYKKDMFDTPENNGENFTPGFKANAIVDPNIFLARPVPTQA